MNWLCFLFAMVVSGIIICASIINITGQIGNILTAPAATSNITIDELRIVSPEHEYEITVKGFSGQVNSRLIDILLMAMN